MEIQQTPAAAIHAFLTMGHNVGRIPEPLDCSTPILDLCTRRRSRSTSPEGDSQHRMTMTHPMQYTETPSSTMGVSSPGSQAGSETSETSISSDLYRDVGRRSMQTSLTPKVKVPRPFKAYPKDPLSLAAAECMISKESAEAYSEFRKRMLDQVQATNGVTNKNMRRLTQNSNHHSREDSNYWEKRRKNNEAAKRSRDARRAKEDELAIRAAFLERENLSLRCEVANLRMELDELRNIVYRRPVV